MTYLDLSHLEAAETSENQLEEIDSPSNDCLQTLKGLLQMSESCLVTEYLRNGFDISVFQSTTNLSMPKDKCR